MSSRAFRLTMTLAAAAVTAAALSSSVAIGATRTSAVNGRAESDLRNLAVAEETYFTDFDHYGTFAQLDKGADAVPASAGVTLRIVHVDGSTGYCLAAVTSTRNHYVYDSQGNGLAHRANCQVTTHGRFGGVEHHVTMPKGPAAALTDLRNLALAEETYLTDNGHRYGTYADAVHEGFLPSAHVKSRVAWYDHDRAYCLEATEHAKHRYYNSAKGGILPLGENCSQMPKGAKKG